MQNIIVVNMSERFGCCNSVGTGFCWRLLQMWVCTYMSVPKLQFLDFLQCLMCKCSSYHRADGQVWGDWSIGRPQKPQKSRKVCHFRPFFGFCNVCCAIVQVPVLPSFRRTGWWWPVERAASRFSLLSFSVSFHTLGGAGTDLEPVPPAYVSISFQCLTSPSIIREDLNCWRSFTWTSSSRTTACSMVFFCCLSNFVFHEVWDQNYIVPAMGWF